MPYEPFADTWILRRKEPLVVIGASAGGPSALSKLLSGLPAGFPAAVVIVQHLDERFAAGMAEWLDRECPLPVRLARDGDALTPGNVLLAASGEHIVLRRSERLGYAAEPREHPYRPSIDIFFESVSVSWKGDVVGVLLTGMGRDGAKGLRSLRNKGHYTIAQDQATSAVYGMPKAAVALDAAVDVLPLERIAVRLVETFCSKRPIGRLTP